MMVKKILFLLLLISQFWVISAAAQETGVVNTRGPIRGTATSTGIVTAFLESGETFEVIQIKGAWYLVQSSKYVGWMHGNYIRLDEQASLDRAFGTRAEDVRTSSIQETRPRTTSKPATGSDEESPFSEQYVGGSSSKVYVSNSSNRTMNLNFGGVRYVLKSGEKQSIVLDGGNYEFTASAPGVRPKSGVREFRVGYTYTWDFFIVKRRV